MHGNAGQTNASDGPEAGSAEHEGRLFDPTQLLSTMVLLAGAFALGALLMSGTFGLMTATFQLKTDIWADHEGVQHAGIGLAMVLAAILAGIGRARAVLVGTLVVNGAAVLLLATSPVSSTLQGLLAALLGAASLLNLVGPLVLALEALPTRTGWGTLVGGVALAGVLVPRIALSGMSLLLVAGVASLDASPLEQAPLLVATGCVTTAALLVVGLFVFTALRPASADPVPPRHGLVRGTVLPLLGAGCLALVVGAMLLTETGVNRIVNDSLSFGASTGLVPRLGWVLGLALAFALSLVLALVGYSGEQLRWRVPSAIVPLGLVATLLAGMVLLVLGVLPEAVLLPSQTGVQNLVLVALVAGLSVWAGPASPRVRGVGTALYIGVTLLVAQLLPDAVYPGLLLGEEPSLVPITLTVAGFAFGGLVLLGLAVLAGPYLVSLPAAPPPSSR